MADDEDAVFSLEGRQLKLDTAEDAAPYVAKMKQNKLVREVRLGGNTFGVAAGCAIAAALGDMEDLRVARLGDMFTGRLRSEIPAVVAALAAALVTKKHLIEVHLSDNAFGPAGAEPLQRLLRENRAIEVLHLNNTGLGIEGARLVADALADAAHAAHAAGESTRLRVFVAGRNRVESAGATHLSRALAAHRDSLETLQMPQNAIRPEGVASLLEAVSECSNLRALDLQDNTFTATGAAALAAALPAWPRLEVLNVGDCLLSAEGGCSVLEALLVSGAPLVSLQLQFNEIDSKGAELVSQLIQATPTLASLALNGNAFDPEHAVVARIRDALTSNGHPSALDELDEMEWSGDEDSDDYGSSSSSSSNAGDVAEDHDATVDALADDVAKINVNRVAS